MQRPDLPRPSLADDNRFVAISLITRKVLDNSQATGRFFAAALDLMAGGIMNREVLKMFPL